MEAVTQTNEMAKEVERLLAESEWITGLAVSLLGDAHQAEDLAQETRLAALRNPRQRSEGSLRPWLATVARNAARKLYRSDSHRRSRETERGRDRAQELGSSPEELLANLETQELVSRLVRELPEELSDVIVLSFFEGLSAEQISKLRKIPAGTVRWRKKKGLDCLRERLDTHFEGDRSAWMSALLPLVSPAWRTGAKAATAGGGVFAGIFAPWIAMTLTWKIVSIALLAGLIAIPFAVGGDDGLQNEDSGVIAQVEPAATVAPAERVEPLEAPLDATVSNTTRTTVAPQAAAAAAPAHPVTRVRLRVVNEQGRPIENAKVRIAPSTEVQVSHAQLLEELNPLEIAGLLAQMERLTDSEGIARWESDLLRMDGMVDFDVVGPRFETGSIAGLLEVGGDLDLGDVILKAAGSVSGRVMDPSGPAPKSIRVTLLAVERDEQGVELEADVPKGLMMGTASTRTDANGAFEFDGVPAGEYRAYVQVLPDWTSFRSQPFEVQLGARAQHVEVRCDVPLGKSSNKNIVVLGADGQPLTTAYVTIRNGGYSSSGRVDGQGTWGNLGDQAARFAGGELFVVDQSMRHRAKTVSPLPAPLDGLTVQLELADTLERTLRLRSSDGTPVGEARLIFTRGEEVQGKDLTSAEEVLALPAAAGERFDVRLLAHGFLPMEWTGLEAASLPEPWEVELTPQIGIRGVVTANGEPLPKAKVTLHWLVADGAVSTMGNDVNLALFSKADEAEADAAGAFRLHQDEPGQFLVKAAARGFGDGYAIVREYDPVLGHTQLQIELLEEGVVEGTVRDHLGQPVPRAYVVLDHPFHKAKRKRASKDGTFRIRRVPAGDWVLHVVDEFEDGFFNQTSQVVEGWQFPKNCVVRGGQTTQQDVILPDPGSTSITAQWVGPKNEARPLSLRIETLNGGLVAHDPFLPYWELQQALPTGENLEIPVQAGRGYQVRVETPGLEGRLYCEFQSEALPAEIDIDFEFATLSLNAEDLKASGATLEHIVIRWERGPWKFSSMLWPDEDLAFASTLVPAGDLTMTYQVAGEPNIRKIERKAVPNETLAVVLE